MLVNIDAQDISALSQQFGKLVSALLEVVKISAMPQAVEITHVGNFRGFDGSQFYVILYESQHARSDINPISIGIGIYFTAAD